ncbi:unnamed protein product [Hymenolepis diminuta]|uniref:AGC-kinase C-terminal domain-containing protein n=1 Tax=Hymenolepis diminuta TaxID=6216 RepID=A0A0R3S863_HYMDI|nr:unnamed protein product [Hymenolepis diminuta]VUZ51262.1 unnamed protein product [Hymenolepis diminuta]
MYKSTSKEQPPNLVKEKVLTKKVHKELKNPEVKVSETPDRISGRRSSSTGDVQLIAPRLYPPQMAVLERRKSKSYSGFDDVDGMTVDFCAVPAFLNEETEDNTPSSGSDNYFIRKSNS